MLDIGKLIQDSRSVRRVPGMVFKDFSVRLPTAEYKRFRDNLLSEQLYASAVVERLIEAFNAHVEAKDSGGTDAT